MPSVEDALHQSFALSSAKGGHDLTAPGAALGAARERFRPGYFGHSQPNVPAVISPYIKPSIVFLMVVLSFFLYQIESCHSASA